MCVDFLLNIISNYQRFKYIYKYSCLYKLLFIIYINISFSYNKLIKIFEVNAIIYHAYMFVLNTRNK